VLGSASPTTCPYSGLVACSISGSSTVKNPRNNLVEFQCQTKCAAIFKIAVDHLYFLLTVNSPHSISVFLTVYIDGREVGGLSGPLCVLRN
jgi:hypothetical protein